MAKKDDAPAAPASESPPPAATQAPAVTPEAPATPPAAAPATPAAAPAAEPLPSPAEFIDKIRAEQDQNRLKGRERAAAAVGRYRITLGNITGEYDARDANEAWAMFCDANKTWPSPNRSGRVIERVG